MASGHTFDPVMYRLVVKKLVEIPVGVRNCDATQLLTPELVFIHAAAGADWFSDLM